jgi:dTDP-4-dehydrorhamnose reductase
VNPRGLEAVVTGAGGQLGAELLAAVPPGWRATGLRHADLDITDRDAVRSWLAAAQPAVIINAAAYTAVDRAEEQPELAHAVNSDGAANLAGAAREVGARLVHVSTDFAFDGSAARPYPPAASPSPLGAYARSKVDGEVRVMALGGGTATVIRTGWLYSARGRNFVMTMLRLMRERGAVDVVADQIGTPTWASGFATVLWAAATRADMPGIWHWADAGVASRYDLAVAVRDESWRLGLLDRPVDVLPIATGDYPALAPRPPFSVLECAGTRRHLGLAARHWSESLRDMLTEVREMGGTRARAP